MARICDGRRPGARAVPAGDGRGSRTPSTSSRGAPSGDAREILRETMFAPTVTGSPLESACRVIAATSRTGRGYYSGVVALIGRDADGERDAGLGHPHPHRRHRRRRASCGSRSAPRWYATPTRRRRSAETRAKAAGLLAAAASGTRPTAGFADAPPGPRGAGAAQRAARPLLAGRRTQTPTTRACCPGGKVLVVDAEDTFTAMLDHQLQRAGPGGDGPPLRRAARPRRLRPGRAGARARRPARRRRPQIARLRTATGAAAGRAAAVPRGLPQPPGAQPPARTAAAPPESPESGHAAGDRPVRPAANGSASTTPSPPSAPVTRSRWPASARSRCAETRPPVRCTRCAGRTSPRCSSTPSRC